MTSCSDMPPERFLENFYTSFQEEVVFGEEETGAVVDRYFSPGFVQTNDGIPMDREKLIAYLRPVRRTLKSGYYEVREAIAHGGRLAARMIVHAVTRKGTRVDTEIYLFADLDAQGRFRRIDQITRSLPTER